MSRGRRSVRALTDAPACLQQKTQTYSNAVPVETAERAFQVSEELNVPEGRAKIVRLADCMLQPVVTEQNLVGSKAVMKGTANLQLTYLDEQNELRTLSLAVPFSQYCQLQGDYEQNEDVETALLVTGVQLEPVDTETGQKLLFGAGILAQCTVIQPQTLTLCEDAYSTRGDFQPQWQEQEYSMRLDAQTLREPIRAVLPGAGVRRARLPCLSRRDGARAHGRRRDRPRAPARGHGLHGRGRRGAVRILPHRGQLQDRTGRGLRLRGRLPAPAGGLCRGRQRCGRAAVRRGVPAAVVCQAEAAEPGAAARSI